MDAVPGHDSIHEAQCAPGKQAGVVVPILKDEPFVVGPNALIRIEGIPPGHEDRAGNAPMEQKLKAAGSGIQQCVLVGPELFHQRTLA